MNPITISVPVPYLRPGNIYAELIKDIIKLDPDPTPSSFELEQAQTSQCAIIETNIYSISKEDLMLLTIKHTNLYTCTYIVVTEGPIISKDGSQRWYKDGKRHRENGPAVVYKSGEQHWYINDKRHRENGPAVVYANGLQYWYINGELHNDNGPAVIYSDGELRWYINSTEYTFDDYTAKLNTPDEDKLMLQLKWSTQ